MKVPASLVIIGDVHGRMDEYMHATRRAEWSLQLGDLGFEYDCLANVDPHRHRVVAGNHDNYAGEVLDERDVEKAQQRDPTARFTVNMEGAVVRLIHQTAHFLGDFGTWSVLSSGVEGGPKEIFYCRGAKSTDKADRTPGTNWFAEEELTEARLKAAVEFYGRTQPYLVATHTAPTSLLPQILPGTILRPTRTNDALQRMFEMHQPKYWLFGHYHIPWGKQVGGTRFFCLAELQCAVFNSRLDFQPPLQDAASWFVWRNA